MVAHGLVHARTNEHTRDIPVHGGPRQGPNLLEQRVLVPAHPRPRPVVVERPELSREVRDDLVEDQTEAQLPPQTSNDIGFACSRRPPHLVSKRRLEGWKQNAPCSGYGVADNLPGAPLFAATELQPSPFAGMVLHRSSPEHRCRLIRHHSRNQHWYFIPDERHTTVSGCNPCFAPALAVWSPWTSHLVGRTTK